MSTPQSSLGKKSGAGRGRAQPSGAEAESKALPGSQSLGNPFARQPSEKKAEKKAEKKGKRDAADEPPNTGPARLEAVDEVTSDDSPDHAQEKAAGFARNVEATRIAVATARQVFRNALQADRAAAQDVLEARQAEHREAVKASQKATAAAQGVADALVKAKHDQDLKLRGDRQTAFHAASKKLGAVRESVRLQFVAVTAAMRKTNAGHELLNNRLRKAFHKRDWEAFDGAVAEIDAVAEKNKAE